MRTFSFRGFGKLVSLLPNQSASFILPLEELSNIVKIPQVVKILTIVPLLIETGIQVSHHIAGKREVNSHPHMAQNTLPIIITFTMLKKM